MRVLVATGNAHELSEFARLLGSDFDDSALAPTHEES